MEFKVVLQTALVTFLPTAGAFTNLKAYMPNSVFLYAEKKLKTIE
jgi:hypothetical protein